MQYGNRVKKVKFLASPIGIVIILVVLIILSRAAIGIHSKQKISSHKLEIAIKELESLEVREQELERNLGKLAGDEGIEAELRTKFRAVKPGESVAVIVSSTDPTRLQSANTIDAPVIIKKRGLIPRLLQVLGF